MLGPVCEILTADFSGDGGLHIIIQTQVDFIFKRKVIIQRDDMTLAQHSSLCNM